MTAAAQLYFFYDTNNNKRGPFDAQQLKDLAANGVIMPNTIVERDDGKQSTGKMIKGLKLHPVYVNDKGSAHSNDKDKTLSDNGDKTQFSENTSDWSESFNPFNLILLITNIIFCIVMIVGLGVLINVQSRWHHIQNNINNIQADIEANNKAIQTVIQDTSNYSNDIQTKMKIMQTDINSIKSDTDEIYVRLDVKLVDILRTLQGNNLAKPDNPQPNLPNPQPNGRANRRIP
ncbi:hypothetical protein FACS189419_03980 [Planctomycetales bacterium]|nr:hypothetical protein FACS189419_03980 [Planctomycetales bacterium]